MKRRHWLLQTLNPTSFITTSIVESTPIFTHEEPLKILLNNINFYSANCYIQIHGFVIMPNHIHLLLTGENQKSISQFMGRLKQYSSRQIINWCIQNREVILLKTFSLSAKETKRNHNYKVWQSGFHNVVITEYKNLLIKLNYIHNNPVQDRWNLCKNSADYPHSSSRYYLNGEDVGIPIIRIS
jgi:putative transposase